MRSGSGTGQARSGQEALKADLARFERVVLWGFRTREHSHRYIHAGYFEFLQQLGVPVHWVDDAAGSNAVVTPRSLVMVPDVHLTANGQRPMKHLFRDDVSYILHPGEFLPARDLAATDPAKVVRLYEHRKFFLDRLSVDHRFERVRPFVYRCEKDRILVQPWGADLPYDAFHEPVMPSGNEFWFVGTIWGDPEGLVNGNRKKLVELGEALAAFGIEFHQTTGVSTAENIKLVRRSRISASVGSIGHAENSYLQCRMFKNISYGQPTITDVPGFQEILGDAFVGFDTWANGIATILALGPDVYVDLARRQQERIRDYTYVQMWRNMVGLLPDRQREFSRS